MKQALAHIMAFESIVIVQVWLVTEIGLGICRCGKCAVVGDVAKSF